MEGRRERKMRATTMKRSRKEGRRKENIEIMEGKNKKEGQHFGSGKWVKVCF